MVLSFGVNEEGQLGHGDKEYKCSPTPVADLENLRISAVAAGWNQNFVLTDKHQLFSWGKGGHSIGQPHRKDSIIFFATVCEMVEGLELVQIACGREHTLALSKSGHVYAWGKADHGQLGQNNREASVFPLRVPALRDKEIIQVASGLDHCLALSRDQRVWSWGYGVDGQLGHGKPKEDDQEVLVPKEVVGLRGARIERIACGTDNSAFISEDGELFTCGNGEIGQLGHGDKGLVFEPGSVPMDDPVLDIALSGAHTVALTRNGKVWSWGWGDEGRLGLGSNETQLYPTEIESLTSKKITAVHCGGAHSLCTSEDGKVYTWGFGAHGRLGHGDENNRTQPKQIEALAGFPVLLAACGLDHSLLVIQTPSGEARQKLMAATIDNFK